MLTPLLLKFGRLPGADAFLSFIGRRILGAFSLLRTAILVAGVANLLLFQYLDAAEARERDKLAEQGKLEHLSFVIDTQIQAYESAVWETGRLPPAVTSGRDLYTAEATDDLLALHKLNGPLLAPGGALHGFVVDYIRLNNLWQTIVPGIGARGDVTPLRHLWTGQGALIAGVSQSVADYQQRVRQELLDLQAAKTRAKQVASIASLLISLISFALSIVLAVILTRQIVPPVTNLRDALQRVAKGDFSPGAAARGRDEISDLLNTFNASIGNLRDLLVAVRGQALGISTESQRLRDVYAREGLLERQSAALQGALAAVERMAQSTAGRVGAAPDDAAAVARLASNLHGLDAEALRVTAELRALMQEVQTAQARMAGAAGSLDRAAEELRQAIAQFQIEGAA